MASPFDVSVETAASVHDVYAALGTEQYWHDRLATYGGSMTLELLEVSPDGSIAVTTVQDLRRATLPSAFAGLAPGEAKVTRAETWQPPTDGRATAELIISAVGVPASGRGTAALEPAPGGSRMSLKGKLEVKIPLLGGRIENYIVGQIAEEIPEVQRFTTEWISRNS